MMTDASGGLRVEALQYTRAAARTLEQQCPGEPSPFDYLSYADACTVHMPNDPIREQVQHLRRSALCRTREHAKTLPAYGEDALGTALSFLISEAERGYPALLHTMEFPVSAGFCAASGVQSADVFARSIVLETLGHAQRSGLIDVRQLLARGVEYFMQTRRRARNAGWAYFPGLLELAPDMDTLAQVTRVVWLAGRKELAARYAMPLLERYERESAESSFETWLYDDEERMAQLQRHWASSAWGTGTDPEVLANVVHAMATAAPERFSGFMQRAQRALCDASHGGTWTSTWYHGPYYGTFVCVRALAGEAQAHSLLRAARKFLLDTQHLDGGWGDEGSDPLSTSLALLTLGLIGEECRAQVYAAHRYFARCAREGALVVAVPFIRMNLGRARKAPGPILSYGSASITAAFVASALMQPKAGTRAVS